MFLGRVACGLPLGDPRFAVLPPHFADPESDELREIIVQAVSGIEKEPEMLQGMKILLASIAFHAKWIRKFFVHNHPVFDNYIFSERGVLDKLRGWLYIDQDPMVEVMFNMKFDTLYTDAANNATNMAATLAVVREVEPSGIDGPNESGEQNSPESEEPVLGELTDFPTPRYAPRGLSYKSPYLQATGVPAKTLLIMEVRRLAIEAHHQRLEQLKMEGRLLKGFEKSLKDFEERQNRGSEQRAGPIAVEETREQMVGFGCLLGGGRRLLLQPSP